MSLRASTISSSMPFDNKPPPPPKTIPACATQQTPRAIQYKDVTPDELFEVARLVVAAEIAKIHTIEWTPQLLYNEPLTSR